MECSLTSKTVSLITFKKKKINFEIYPRDNLSLHNDFMIRRLGIRHLLEIRFFYFMTIILFKNRLSIGTLVIELQDDQNLF